MQPAVVMPVGQTPGALEPSALRHSQLAPCSFQYTSTVAVHHRVSQLKSNPTKFQRAISVRLKLKPNEPDKSQTAVFQFVIVVQLVQSVPSARSPHGVFHGRPPFDGRLPVFPTVARLFFGEAYLSIKVPLTRLDPVHPTVARHSPPPSSAARDAAPRGRA